MHGAPSLAAGATSTEAPDCLYFFVVAVIFFQFGRVGFLVSMEKEKPEREKVKNKGIRRINWNLESVEPQRQEPEVPKHRLSLILPLAGERFRHRPVVLKEREIKERRKKKFRRT